MRLSFVPSVSTFSMFKFLNAAHVIPSPGDFEIAPRLESVTLEFDSYAPSKKNKLRPRPGGMTYADGIKKAMDDLQLQAKVQWGMRPRVKHPELHFWLAAHESQDRDGIITTLLDVLKKAGVIEDDSIRSCNGFWAVYPAETAEHFKSRAKIRVVWE